jgi:hypothetical protein
MLKRVIILGLAAGLVACGDNGANEDATAAAPEGVEAEAPSDDLEPPPVSGDAASADSPDPASFFPSQEPNLYANGPLAVRVETSTLTAVGYNHSQIEYLRLGLVVTFANTTDAPISLAVAQAGPPNVMLDNAISLSSSGNFNWEMSGLFYCQRELEECRTRSPDTFLQIEPGQSIRANITVYGRIDRTRLPEVAGQQGGSLTLLVHVLQGDQSRSIPVNMPVRIQNQITN